MDVVARSVSVIVPTLAASCRAATIRRALESLETQTGVRVLPIVVVNGPNPDREILESLEALGGHGRIRLCRLDIADIPAAIRAGRAMVDTPYFAELDDDDALLPGALAARVAMLEAHPDADVVVTNGYRRTNGLDTLLRSDFAAVRRDPLAALLEGNWLLPGSWLCRTERVGAELFTMMPRYLECTYLAIRFSLTGRVVYHDRPTVVWTEHGGDSRTVEFHRGQPEALEQILRLKLPDGFRRRLGARLAAAHHAVAERYRRSGELDKAWRAHWRSLWAPSGLRYLLATRHYLKASLGAAWSPRGGG